MKHLALLLLALPMVGQTLATIAQTNFSQTQQGQLYRGTITITTPQNCRLTRDGITYSRTRRVYCVGVTGSNCDTTTAAGVIDIQLVPTGAGTVPTGCYYTARMEPTKGDIDTETWVIDSIGPYKISDVRTTVTPSPSARIKYSQIDWSGFGSGCLQVTNGSATPVSCTSGATPRTWDELTETWDELTMAWDDI